MTINRISAIIPGNFANFAVVRLKTHKIGSAAKCIDRVVHLWRRQPRACVRTQGINPRGIMCLLDDVVFGFKPRARNRYKRL